RFAQRNPAAGVTVESYGSFDFLNIPPASIERYPAGSAIEDQRSINGPCQPHGAAYRLKGIAAFRCSFAQMVDGENGNACIRGQSVQLLEGVIVRIIETFILALRVQTQSSS